MTAAFGVFALLIAGGPVVSAATGRGAESAQTNPALAVPAAQTQDLALDEAHGLLYAGGGGAVQVLSLPTLRTVATIDLGPNTSAQDLDLSPDGATLAVARLPGDIVLIDTATRAIVATLTPSSGAPFAVRFGRGGRLYSGGWSKDGTTPDTIHVWDVASRTEVGHSAATGNVGSLAVTGDGQALYAAERTASLRMRLVRYDISTDAPQATGATPGTLTGGAVAVKPDGSRVYGSSGEVWSGDLTTLLGTLPGTGVQDFKGAAYAAGGDAVVTAGNSTLTDAFVARANGTTLAVGVTRHTQRTTALAVNGAGTVVYVATLSDLFTELVAFDFSAPDAPTGVTARAGIGSAVVSWTPPADPGGSPITGYDVISSGGATARVGAGVTTALLTGLSSGDHEFTVDAVNSSGGGPLAVPSERSSPQPGGTFHTLTPTRILDTRNGTGGVPTAPLGPGASLTLKVAGKGGVPATLNQVSAVVLNVTVTDGSAFSFLTVFPAGFAQPLVSNLNWAPTQTVANLVVVALGNDGSVTIFNDHGQANVIFDVAGWVGSSLNSSGPEGMFHALTPSRLLDTRTGAGALGAGETRSLQVTGRGGVPASGVSAVVLNVTVTQPTASSFVTLWPTGETRPLASNLNFQPTETRPNRVMVKVGAGGMVNLYNDHGSAQLIVDVSGWYTDATSAAGGSGLVATIPLRFFDTRDPRFINPPQPLPRGATLRLEVDPTFPLPVSALIMNVTSTDAAAPTFLTLFPDGQSLPLASDLNPVPFQTIPNLTVVRLSALTGGIFDTFNDAGGGAVNIVMDEYGFYGAEVLPLSAQVVVRISEASSPGGRIGANARQAARYTMRSEPPAGSRSNVVV